MYFLKRVLPFILTLLCGIALGNLVNRPQPHHVSDPVISVLENNAGTFGEGGDPNRIYKVGEVTRRVVILSKPEPSFTVKARKNNVTGEVMLRVVFSSTGQVTNIVPIKQLPDGLTEEAIAAARQIKFTPAEKDGRLVSTYGTIAYVFNIY